MADHSELNAIHKAEHDKKCEEALKEDLGIHDARMTKALETKENILAEKQETLTHSNELEHDWHAQAKKDEDDDQDWADKQDFRLDEERMETADHVMEKLAAKKQVDGEVFDNDIAKHQEKASLRHAAAASGGEKDSPPWH